VIYSAPTIAIASEMISEGLLLKCKKFLEAISNLMAMALLCSCRHSVKDSCTRSAVFIIFQSSAYHFQRR